MLNKAVLSLVDTASFVVKRDAVSCYLKEEISLSANLVEIAEYEKDTKYFFLNIYGIRIGRIAWTGVFFNPSKFKSYVLKKIEEYQDIVKPTLMSTIPSEVDLYKALTTEELSEETLALHCTDLLSLAAYTLKNVSNIPKSNLITIQSYLDNLKGKERKVAKKK
jgi:hypothetical protein